MFKLILFYKWLTNQAYEPSQFWEWHGYRRELGGYWAKWEARWRGKETFTVWLPSSCEHFPVPPGITSTKPLETEFHGEMRW